MDIDGFTIEDLLLSAIKAEIESNKVYTTLANKVENTFLKDRLRFLAKEELRHKLFLEGFYKLTFKDKEIVVPERSPVPMPKIIIDEDPVYVSQVLEQAMEAEKAAHDFYLSLAGRIGDQRVKDKLGYIARMEMGHYKLLEQELESLKEFEDNIMNWPMMQMGP